MGALSEKVCDMITIENIALDSLPAELQAFFLSLAPRQSVKARETVYEDQTEQKNAQNPAKREQSASTAHRPHIADVVGELDSIDVHELELIAIDPESFALVADEW